MTLGATLGLLHAVAILCPNTSAHQALSPFLLQLIAGWDASGLVLWQLPGRGCPRLQQRHQRDLLPPLALVCSEAEGRSCLVVEVAHWSALRLTPAHLGHFTTHYTKQCAEEPVCMSKYSGPWPACRGTSLLAEGLVCLQRD